MKLTDPEKMRRAFRNEEDRWFTRYNKVEEKPYELCRHMSETVVRPKVMFSSSSSAKTDLEFHRRQFSAAMAAALKAGGIE